VLTFGHEGVWTRSKSKTSRFQSDEEELTHSIQSNQSQFGWAKQVWLVALFCFMNGHASLQPAIVSGTNPLSTIATSIATSQNPGVQPVIFSKYEGVGTFRIQDGVSSKVDTVKFEAKDSSPGILKLDSELINVSNFKGSLVFDGMAIQLVGPKASIASTLNLSSPNGSLIFRNCLIFADSFTNTVLLSWVGGLGSKIILENSFFVVKNGSNLSTNIVLYGDSVIVRNCNFNIAALFDTHIKKGLAISHNTVNRMQFKLDTDDPLASGKIENNLFAFRGGKNQTLLGNSNYFPIYFAVNFTKQPTGLGSNKYFSSNWAGLFTSTESFTDGSTAISPILNKDTTELWNWYGLDSAAGFDTGPNKSEKFNVFPGIQTASQRILRDSVRVAFSASLIPRIFKPTSDGGFPISDSFPKLRFEWPGKSAYSFGIAEKITGLFKIDSLTFLPDINSSGLARHGAPGLLIQESASGPFKLQSPRNGVGSPLVFVNNTSTTARYFVPVEECEIPFGKNVVVLNTYPGKPNKKDSLVFMQIDSAGRFAPEERVPNTDLDFRRDTRYLGITRSFSTTAITKDTIKIFVKDSLPVPPYLADSIAWERVPDKSASLNTDSFPLYPYRAVAKGVHGLFVMPTTPFLFHVVEHLSVPRGNQTFKGTGYEIRTTSNFGFQIRIRDSLSPNLDYFDQVSSAISLKSFGFSQQSSATGTQDSINIYLTAKGATTAYIKRGATWDLLRNSSIQSDNKVKIKLTALDTGEMIFLGRKLNIVKNTPYNDSLKNLRFSNFTSPTSGMLSVESLSEGDFGVDTLFQSAQFIQGWRLVGEKIAATGFYVSATLAINGDPSQFSAFTRSPGDLSWQAAALTTNTAVSATGNGLVFSVGPINLAKPKLDIVLRRNLITVTVPPKITMATPEGSTQKLTITLPATGIPIGTYRYQIQSLTINQAGTTFKDTVTGNQLEPITLKKISRNCIGIYRLNYFDQSNQIIATQTGILNDIFDTANVNMLGERSAWHLLAVPSNQTAQSVLDTARWLRLTDTITTGKRDTVSILSIGTVNDKQDLVEDTVTTHKEGQAILVASGRPFKLHWGKNEIPLLQSTQISGPDTGGWALVSHPFPFPLKGSQIASDLVANPIFYGLARDSKSAGYSWPLQSTMEAHIGYAYHFQKSEKLTFDPFQSSVLPKAMVSVKNQQFTLSWPGGEREVQLLPGANPKENIPELPSPGNGLELHFGNRRGFFQKAIDRNGRMSEPVYVFSPEARRVFWHVGAMPQGNKAFLLDSLSGRVYFHGTDSVQLRAGWNALHLIAADGEEARQLAESWIAETSKPFEFRLPTLIRGRQPWFVTFRWPAAYAQKGVSLRVLISDLRGHIVFSESLRPTLLGLQKWSPAQFLPTGTLVVSVQMVGVPGLISRPSKVTVLP
jgi:hypothetical protein